jgi:phenylalanyl-tRNA synthetase beta chain
LLAAASRNAARGFSELNLFEIGAAFQSGMPGAQTANAAGLIMGVGSRDWSKSGHSADAFDAKGAMLAALEAVMGAPMSAPVTSGAPAWFHPGRSGVIALGPKQIASFGELHPRILSAFDIKLPAAAFEIILDALPEPKSKSQAPFSPSPFQAIERDFAFVVERGVAAGDIVRAVKNAERNLIDAISLFDVYEGKGVPEGKKSIAIAVRLQPKDKTLTDAEIEAVAQKIISGVAKATGAVLRS